MDITDGNQIVEEVIDIRKPWSGFVLIDTIIRNPEQPRKLFEEHELELLGGSLKSTLQVSPVTAVLYETAENEKIIWMVNDGERRLRALRVNGQLFLWVAYNPLITVDNLFKASAISNLCRKGHTHMENARAIGQLMLIGSYESEKEGYNTIAEQMGFEPLWTTQLHSLNKLHPSLQELIDPPTPKAKRIPIDAAIALASVNHETQLEIWEKVKDAPKGHMSILIRSYTGAAKSTGATRDRRRSDDARIATGKFKSIKALITKALGLPEGIYERIDDDKKPLLKQMVVEMHEMLDQLREKLGDENSHVQTTYVTSPPEKPEPTPQPVVATLPRRETFTEKPTTPIQTKTPPAKRVQVTQVAPHALPPVAPHMIRHNSVAVPAAGTPAEVTEPEKFESPEETDRRIKEKLLEGQKHSRVPEPQFVSVYSNNGNGSAPKGTLTSDQIIANMAKEREEARKRHAPHRGFERRSTLEGLVEGEAFIDENFKTEGALSANN